MSLGTLGASLLGNMFTGKGIVRAGSGRHSLTPLLRMKKKRKKNCKGWLCKKWDF